MKKRYLLPILSGVLSAVILILGGCGLFLNKNADKDGTASVNSALVGSLKSAASETVSSAPEYKPAKATIGSTGDILIHSPILDAYNFNGKYDFHEMFRYVKSYYQLYDYMVANLELTLGGTSRPYSGYPTFNCPDSILDALSDSGVDMMTAANNHCFDLGEDAFFRTVKTLKKSRLDFIGTRQNKEDKPYIVKEINGIKIGMINYTYQTPTSDGSKALNGIPVSKAAAPLINSFDYDRLDDFYKELSERISEMYSDGAEAIMVYMHWGNEYWLEPSTYQERIGQKLCDLGVDVIVGGHPHVVEPVELFRSDISHKQTICLYSMGNEVSNQRKDRMDMTTGHTEDGLIFETTFERKKDGSVTLSDVNILPTWVNLYYGSEGRRHYEIIPLDKSQNWSKFGLSGTADAEASYERTDKLVAKGIRKFKTQYQKIDLRPEAAKSGGANTASDTSGNSGTDTSNAAGTGVNSTSNTGTNTKASLAVVD